ncbi:YjbQ family protein [Ignisphaera sp. 4213-co]|uniref:YjbQ family protein n=1 Tax=Ignisphaera cupida TaxID=3050454 RepID=A0ABD4Z625_9CREN|nr:YjbQ family protein [Ignisphaera sp. 4213-co]MDK6028204.1 YjbQ family protein [Ignisphaera sp. 4213-co]
MKIKIVKLTLRSSGYEVQDITAHVAQLVKENGLENGLAILYTNERGCSVAEIEYEPELLADLETFLQKVGCIDKNICNVLIGKNTFVPVVHSSLFLGQFKNIVFVDVSRVDGEKSLVIVLEGIFKNN